MHSTVQGTGRGTCHGDRVHYSVLRRWEFVKKLQETGSSRGAPHPPRPAVSALLAETETPARDGHPRPRVCTGALAVCVNPVRTGAELTALVVGSEAPKQSLARRGCPKH